MAGSVLVLLELLLVFGLVFGWGLYELRSVRRPRRQREDKRAEPREHSD